MKAIAGAWTRFFFTPTPARTLGVFRFFYGLVVLLSVLGIFPFRETFYGTHAIVSAEFMHRYYSAHPWMVLGFSFVPLKEPGLTFFFIGLLTAAVMLSLGVFTRVASVAVFIGIYSLHNRNLFITNAGDILMRIDALVLLFTDAGAAFSFDRWWAIRRGRVDLTEPLISPWPVRLLQIQLTYLYLTTACLKLTGESWRNGTAMYYALRYLELQRFSFKYLFYYLWQIKLASWGTVAAEMAMGTLVWVPRLRYPILAVAFSLHWGINLALQFPVFQYVMMANLILFIPPQDCEKLGLRLPLVFNRKRAPTDVELPISLRRTGSD